MGATAPRLDVGRWGQVEIGPGQQAEVHITVSESYWGRDIEIPVFVWRGTQPGPSLFVTSAVHGDEINGTGAIRHIIVEQPFKLKAGALVLVPVVNMVGFERHSRYMPDRRDLNRSFPGSREGSMASRMARVIFDEVVRRCDYGIDLHTAAVRRTNFPNVRADMSFGALAEMARAFGTELIVDAKGPNGSLRKTACKSGCPTLILEAGEVWKVEPTVVEYVLRGVRNCLIHLGMADGKPRRPVFQLESRSTKWVRARYGGFLQFHVAPGDVVEKGEPIATNTSLTGQEQNVLLAPRSGIVLGMTTIPSVAPGDAVCHLAFAKKGKLLEARTARANASSSGLHQRARSDLASSVLVNKASDQPG